MKNKNGPHFTARANPLNVLLYGLSIVRYKGRHFLLIRKIKNETHPGGCVSTLINSFVMSQDTKTSTAKVGSFSGLSNIFSGFFHLADSNSLQKEYHLTLNDIVA